MPTTYVNIIYLFASIERIARIAEETFSFLKFLKIFFEFFFIQNIFYYYLVLLINIIMPATLVFASSSLSLSLSLFFSFLLFLLRCVSLAW